MKKLNFFITFLAMAISLLLSVHCDILTKPTESELLSKSTTTTTTMPTWSSEDATKVNKVLSDAGKIVPVPPKNVV